MEIKLYHKKRQCNNFVFNEFNPSKQVAVDNSTPCPALTAWYQALPLQLNSF